MIEHIDEVLSRAIDTDDTPIPRFDIEDENGNVIYPNCRLKLKNPITQAGTPVNKPLLDEFLAASGVTAGTATAYTLAQAGFVLVDGAPVRFRLHTASGASPTLNVAGTGAKALRDAVGLGMTTLAAGTWVTAVYSSAADAYIVQSGGASSRILMLKELTASDETVTITLPSGYRRYRLIIANIGTNITDYSTSASIELNFADGSDLNGREYGYSEVGYGGSLRSVEISSASGYIASISIGGNKPAAYIIVDMYRVGTTLYGFKQEQGRGADANDSWPWYSGSFSIKNATTLTLDKNTTKWQYASGAILLEGLV